MNLINVTARFYLPDLIGETELIKYISETLEPMHIKSIYFWYEKKELDSREVAKFSKMWDELPHSKYKTLIRPQWFDLQRDFIWYDVIPYTKYEEYTPQYWRFATRYEDKKTGIKNGINNCKEIWDFITTDKPQKKQKRNDDESSNYRVEKLHK
jgi:hypothetical protein|tara:strand:+ start:687 stop:1148 length:462 start_codon:yes stop_codon:yes gene_type:complete